MRTRLQSAGLFTSFRRFWPFAWPLAAVLAAASAAVAQTTPEVCECVPATGQPAADVLASHDRWGNPTFIGGITNGGPDSGSVW